MENKRLYIGLDPGAKGAITLINEDGTLFKNIDIPKVGTNYDLREINKVVAEHEIHFGCVEHQQVFGKEGIVSAFKIGFGYGILVMTLESNNISYEEVRPQAWKKMFGLINKDKAASVRAAQKLFPTGQFVGPKGGLYDGRAESALIAEYARRRHLQISPDKTDIF